MTTVQIPPESVPAEFSFDIPAPDGMTTLGGVRLYFIFAVERPESFFPYLHINGERKALSESGVGQTSYEMIAQFPESIPAPARAKVTVNGEGHLDPGNTVTIYAWGAQTASGEGALNPDEGGEPSSRTTAIDVGQVEVLTWPEWYRLMGQNQIMSGS